MREWNSCKRRVYTSRMLFEKGASKDSLISLKHLSSVPYWHRPVGGLVEVVNRMKEKGVSDPTKLGNSYVELYIGSFLVMALQERMGLNFWISKPLQDPPDMAFMTMETDEEKRIKFHSREVEIIRHLNEEMSLIERILCKDRPYPEEYVVACFIEIYGSLDLREISKELKTRSKHIKHIFVVFHGMIAPMAKKVSSAAAGYISVVQLSPEFTYETFDITETWKKGMLDDEKLVYVHEGQVFYGLRPTDVDYPKIIN